MTAEHTPATRDELAIALDPVAFESRWSARCYLAFLGADRLLAKYVVLPKEEQ